MFDYVLVNSNFESKDKIKPEWHVDAVDAAQLQAEARSLGVEIIEADVVNTANPLRHDPEKLAMALMQIHETRGRALVTRPTASHAERELVADTSAADG